mmetsp:Transcript_16953/g.50011  ORF Transcript_16953/g.50011 Transcript_16953/m.50011 type:complete len:202 (+) Transcript_16953:905-1510(+)
MCHGAHSHPSWRGGRGSPSRGNRLWVPHGRAGRGATAHPVMHRQWEEVFGAVQGLAQVCSRVAAVCDGHFFRHHVLNGRAENVVEIGVNFQLRWPQHLDAHLANLLEHVQVHPHQLVRDHTKPAQRRHPADGLERHSVIDRLGSLAIIRGLNLFRPKLQLDAAAAGHQDGPGVLGVRRGSDGLAEVGHPHRRHQPPQPPAV